MTQTNKQSNLEELGNLVSERTLAQLVSVLKRASKKIKKR